MKYLKAAMTSLILVLAAATLSSVSPQQASAASALRVFDWNIEGGSAAYDGPRWQGIVSTIKNAGADVVTLQEVHRSAGLTVDGHPGIDQVAELQKAFPGWNFHFSRGDATDPAGSSAGNLIFSRYPIQERLTLKLPNRDGCPTDRDQYPKYSATCPVNRVLAGVNLDVDGTDVRVYSTHLSVGVSATTLALRAAQVSKIADTLPQAHLNLPMFFSGDLNFEPNAYDNRAALAKTRFYDVWTQQLPNDDGVNGTHAGSDGRWARIDYLYATPAVDVSSVGANSSVSGLSDHRPVTAAVTVHVSPPLNVGVVLAGQQGLAGSANMTVFRDHASKLRICDGEPDGYGVRATVTSATGSTTYLSGSDGAYADRCAAPTTPPGVVPGSFVVQVCLYKGSDVKDCSSAKFG